MRFLSDDRAQSIQIGAVLLFGVLVVLLSVWQATIIPSQNEDIEFNHNQDIQQQLTELRSTVNSMPGALNTRSVTLGLGVRYPSRTIFRNPGPASGTVQTIGTTDQQFNLTISNATAVESNIDAFWNGTGRQYNTGTIQYRPSYNEYRNAPQTTFEHSVLFNRFEREDATLPITGQALIRDTRLTFVALNGSLSESRVESTSVDFDPISTDTRPVEIRDDTGPITLTMPTRLDEQQWRELLSEERVTNGGHVQSISTTPIADSERELLELTLEDGERYRLHMSKVGVGTGTTDTESAYLTDIEGNNTSIQKGNSQKLTVEVRDRFNNPKSDIWVNASAEGGLFRDNSNTTSERSDLDGQVEFIYQGNDTGSNDINVTIKEGYQPQSGSGHNAAMPENVTMNVGVVAVSNGSVSNGNPPSFSVLDATSDKTSVTFDWEVTGTFNTVTVESNDDSGTSTDRNGQLQIDKSPGSRSITAEVTGPGGTETCTATIGNSGELTIDDFSCN
ncbi:hypothetical protein [Halobacteriaceae bacterium SHR40]|uniref:hypothetical protein n=1 Tax=Halovenus amylolytica TaxID=2500550 RepID=UPI000FE309BB